MNTKLFTNHLVPTRKTIAVRFKANFIAITFFFFNPKISKMVITTVITLGGILDDNEC